MNKSDPLRQIQLAAVLLTRLPLPALPQRCFAMGAQAVWAYPLMGVLVGGAGLGAGHLALWLGLPALAAALLALGTMVVLTGAMHEDGLADVCDGFWGGFDPARRLEIMRDSQIGTYGVLGLLLVTGLRLSALVVLLPSGGAAVIAAAVLSRAAMPLLMWRMMPARRDGLAVSVGQVGGRPALFGLVIACAIALMLLGGAAAGAVVVMLLAATGTGALAQRKIGGQSGDVLGATQQLSEAAILLLCAALL